MTLGRTTAPLAIGSATLLPGAWALAYLGLFRAPTHWTAQIATIVLLVVIGCNLVFLLRAIRARKTLHGL